MLPCADANRFTEDFASREILGRVAVPALLRRRRMRSAPRLERSRARLKAAGYAGPRELPTAIHVDGRFGGPGAGGASASPREVELLQAAKRPPGLVALGYGQVPGRGGAARRGAGVDMLCLNFGWNAGGTLGIAGRVALRRGRRRARRIFQTVRQTAPARSASWRAVRS
jgi:predicted TIM-barrel enzyme